MVAHQQVALSTGSPGTAQVNPTPRNVVDAQRGVRCALIVDEESRSASHLRESLDRMSVQVFTVRSVAEAAVLTRSESPHLLVLTLPVDDPGPGLALAGWLRSQFGTACILVLDRLDRATIQAANDAGASAVLCKPIHREQLEATFCFAL